MRIPSLVTAIGCALALAACTRTYVERERAVPAQPATVQTVPGATIVTPGVAPAAPPSAIIVR